MAEWSNWYGNVPPESRYSAQEAHDFRRIADVVADLQEAPGSPGAVAFDVPASEDISAWRAVHLNDAADGVEVAQPVSDVVVLGITTSAVLDGNDVTLIRTGAYTDPSWTWTPGQSIVLFADGVLGQGTPPGAEVLQPLGLAISPTRMLVRIDTKIGI